MLFYRLLFGSDKKVMLPSPLGRVAALDLSRAFQRTVRVAGTLSSRQRRVNTSVADATRD
jgi:hypothetical protein